MKRAWALILFAAFLLVGCGSSSPQFVVLYTSQDQFYAEPILKDFTRKTGIDVRAVYDTESAKTAGLANRLRAESRNPQCDVFWSNEEMHSRALATEGILQSASWVRAGSRSRLMVINTNLVAAARTPASLLELTNAAWKGRVAFAYPLFGTTQSHFLALRQLWGEAVWENWCRGLVQNEAKIVDGNSVVVKLVGAGECAIGLTDSDDVAAGLQQNYPIIGMECDAESLTIPSTMALVANAPHASAGRELMKFLSQRETLQHLVSMNALESVEAEPAQHSRVKMDWATALRDAPTVTRFLQKIFLRT